MERACRLKVSSFKTISSLRQEITSLLCHSDLFERKLREQVDPISGVVVAPPSVKHFRYALRILDAFSCNAINCNALG